MTTIWAHDPAAVPMPAPQLWAAPDPAWIEAERPEDHDARETLLDRAFGPARFGKTCERLRAGRLPAAGLSLVARADEHGRVQGVGSGAVMSARLVGTVRLWHVAAGGVPALMLGPLAVDAGWRKSGLGARLMHEAIARAAALGHAAILLVGDAPYYARFGFSRTCAGRLEMPGPVDADRFLGLELRAGGLAAAQGLVRPTGAVDLAKRRVHRRARPRRAA